MSKKVALMCGHGTQTNGVWDAGCSYGTYTEAALMLPITKAAVKYLRNYGVTVISDADTGNKKNMIADVAWANKERTDIYVSIHCDYSKAPSGVMPLYVSANGKKLATALNTAVKNGIPMKSRGVCKRTDLYELNATDMPACILETGAIKADLKILKNDYDKYGKLIAQGICNYLGVKITANTTPAKTETKTLYRVRKSWNDSKSQIGAYASLDNAKKECDKHPGYSVYGENGKVLYTATKVTEPTNAMKLVTKARELCWPYGTAQKKWAYTTGSALVAYKNALKKYMGKSAKISLSDCGYLMTTIVRAAGISSSFVALGSTKASFPVVPGSMKIAFKGKKIPDGTLQAGDIIRYKKTSGSQHTLMYMGAGKIAEAGRKIRFPVIRQDTKKYNASNVKHSTIQVIRAK